MRPKVCLIRPHKIRNARQYTRVAGDTCRPHILQPADYFGNRVHAVYSLPRFDAREAVHQTATQGSHRAAPCGVWRRSRRAVERSRSSSRTAAEAPAAQHPVSLSAFRFEHCPALSTQAQPPCLSRQRQIPDGPFTPLPQPPRPPHDSGKS